MNASKIGDLLTVFRAAEAVLDRMEVKAFNTETTSRSPFAAGTPPISQELLSGIDDFIGDLRRETLEGLAKPRAVTTLRELLGYHDIRFVEVAYLTLLQRPADPPGLDHYVEALRSGKLSKVEVAGRMRLSSEGRDKRVALPGLLVRYAARAAGRISVVGYPVRWFMVVARLPEWPSRLQRIESLAMRSNEKSADGGAEQIQRLAESTRALAASVIGQANQGLADVLRRQQEAVGIEEFDGLRRQVVEADARVVAAMRRQDEQLTLHTTELAGVASTARAAIDEIAQTLQRYRQNMEWLERFEPPSSELLEHREASIGGKRPGFYSRFEEHFRGTRADILERMDEVYPHIAATRDLLQGVHGSHALDLGCGRGEWLEIMGRNDYPALGIDVDDDFLGELRDRGLEGRKADAIAFLRTLPSDSVPLITAFHLVEHLTLRQLLALLDECFRVLCRDGQVLFETPNPENVTVGANHFWHDFTHVRPLAPDIMEFLLQDRGFVNLQILRLRKNRIRDELPYCDAAFAYNHELNSLVEVVNKTLVSPPDYAVRGTKTALAAQPLSKRTSVELGT